jgi:hypothetical protein
MSNRQNQYDIVGQHPTIFRHDLYTLQSRIVDRAALDEFERPNSLPAASPAIPQAGRIG